MFCLLLEGILHGYRFRPSVAIIMDSDHYTAISGHFHFLGYFRDGTILPGSDEVRLQLMNIGHYRSKKVPHWIVTMN